MRLCVAFGCVAAASAALDSGLVKSLCAIEAAPERFHEAASFLAVPRERRDAVMNPFLNDSYPLSDEALERATPPGQCGTRFQKKLAQVAKRRPPKLKVCVTGGSETAGNGCLGANRERPQPSDHCAWWRRFGGWLDAAYPGVAVTVMGLPRSGETIEWFADELGSPRGRPFRSCDVLFIDHSINDAALYDGEADGPERVARAVKAVEAALSGADDETAPATAWLLIPRIVTLSLKALEAGNDLVQGSGTAAIYRKVLGRYGTPLISYTDVALPEIARLVADRRPGLAAVYHNAGAHGAHIDWRNHQLIADTVARWWRTTATGLCERSRRGLAPVTPCDGVEVTVDDDDGGGGAGGGAGRTLGCAGALRSTDPADEVPALVPAATTKWRLFPERPDRPSGWHAAEGEVVFAATCRASGDRLEDAAITLGSLRTDDARWGAVDAWVAFANEKDPTAKRLVAAGYGLGAKVRIDARWKDRRSEVVLDRVPCYAAPPDFPRVDAGAPIKLLVHVAPVAEPDVRHFKIVSVESCDRAVP